MIWIALVAVLMVIVGVVIARPWQQRQRGGYAVAAYAASVFTVTFTANITQAVKAYAESAPMAEVLLADKRRRLRKVLDDL